MWGGGDVSLSVGEPVDYSISRSFVVRCWPFFLRPSVQSFHRPLVSMASSIYYFVSLFAVILK